MYHMIGAGHVTDESAMMMGKGQLSNLNIQILQAAQHHGWVHNPTGHTFFCHLHTLRTSCNLRPVAMEMEILDGHKAQACQPGPELGTATSTHSLYPHMYLLPTPTLFGIVSFC